jgi:RNA polymerase sigma-70 factor, ECF subfamily
MAAADAILAKARAGDAEAFRALTDPHRAELQAHCYRMLGSLQDAEDVVQETLLAAWRALRSFEGRSSPRAWLYRIATNRCLNVLRDERAGAAARTPDRFPPPTRYVEPLHLEPFPDALLDRVADAAPGPAARYETHEALSLAFVSGLQRLPAQQRAVLVLRDVLGFSARDVADILTTSETGVNSALQRARTAIEQRPGARDAAALPASAVGRRLAARFADAFLAGDVDGVVALLRPDARLTMPPLPLEYEGRRAIRAFLSGHGWWGSDGVRLVPTRANGQPALALYLDEADGSAPALNGLLVLTVQGDAIAAITRFGSDGIHPAFGLPATLAV